MVSRGCREIEKRLIKSGETVMEGKVIRKSARSGRDGKVSGNRRKATWMWWM